MKSINLREAVVADQFALARILINATNSAFYGRVPKHCLTSLGVTESAANWRRSKRAGYARPVSVPCRS